MLLITRRRGEKLKIGDNVEVTLVGMRNGAAQIGIDAPRDVTILRNELLPKSEGLDKEEASKQPGADRER